MVIRMVRTNDRTFCVEVKEHQVKKGSKWVTTEREIDNLTAQEYRNSCGEETMKYRFQGGFRWSG